MSNDNGETQLTFDSTEQASKKWIKDGIEYTSAINEWIENAYEIGWDNVDTSTMPKETRGNMINYVVNYLSKANENNDFTSSRQLFPPAYEPTVGLLENQAKPVTKIMLLDDLRIIARVGNYSDNPEFYEINNDNVKKINDLKCVGACPNKKYYSKAYEDRIDITDGWDGDVIRTLKYPRYSDIIENFDFKDYKDYSVVNIHVFPNGEKILLLTDGGIFAITEDHVKLLFPTDDILEEELEECRKNELFKLTTTRPHAAITKDGYLFAFGCEESNHLIMEHTYELLGLVYPRCGNSHFAMIHTKCFYVALNSYVGNNGATVGVPMDIILDFEADAEEDDGRLYYLDEVSRVYAAVPLDVNIVVGDAKGYLFCRRYCELTNWYCFVGSTICDMDISKDEKYIAVSNIAGFVQLLKLDAETKDEHIITNSNIKEEKRWVFWKDYKPMVW